MFGTLNSEVAYAGIGWYLICIGAFSFLLLLLSFLIIYFKFLDKDIRILYNKDKKGCIDMGDLILVSIKLLISYLSALFIYLELKDDPQIVLVYILYILPLVFDMFDRVRKSKGNIWIYYSYGLVLFFNFLGLGVGFVIIKYPTLLSFFNFFIVITMCMNVLVVLIDTIINFYNFRKL